MTGGGGRGGGFDLESDDPKLLLRSNPYGSGTDLDSCPSTRKKVISDLLRNLDHGFSGRRLSRRNVDPGGSIPPSDGWTDGSLGDGAPPKWALLLIGGLLGLPTAICDAALNRGRRADTWHRILLIPMTGVVDEMMHGLLEIFEQIKQSRSSQSQNIDWVAGIFPTIKAIQAAVTLAKGCSLGPEGPSVDIGKSCAKGCSEMKENNRERRIALVTAAGIA